MAIPRNCQPTFNSMQHPSQSGYDNHVEQEKNKDHLWYIDIVRPYLIEHIGNFRHRNDICQRGRLSQTDKIIGQSRQADTKSEWQRDVHIGLPACETQALRGLSCGFRHGLQTRAENLDIERAAKNAQ